MPYSPTKYQRDDDEKIWAEMYADCRQAVKFAKKVANNAIGFVSLPDPPKELRPDPVARIFSVPVPVYNRVPGVRPPRAPRNPIFIEPPEAPPPETVQGPVNLELHTVLALPTDCTKLDFGFMPSMDLYKCNLRRAYSGNGVFKDVSPDLLVRRRDAYESVHGTSTYNLVMCDATRVWRDLTYAWNNFFAPHLDGETDLFTYTRHFLRLRRTGKQFEDRDSLPGSDTDMITAVKEIRNHALLCPHKHVRIIFIHRGNHMNGYPTFMEQVPALIHPIHQKQVDVFTLGIGTPHCEHHSIHLRQIMHTGNPNAPLCHRTSYVSKLLTEAVHEFRHEIRRNSRIHLSVPAKYAPGLDATRSFAFPGEFVYFDKSPEYIRDKLRIYTEEFPVIASGLDWRKRRGEMYKGFHEYQEYGSRMHFGRHHFDEFYDEDFDDYGDYGDYARHRRHHKAAMMMDYFGAGRSGRSNLRKSHSGVPPPGVRHNGAVGPSITALGDYPDQAYQFLTAVLVRQWIHQLYQLHHSKPAAVTVTQVAFDSVSAALDHYVRAANQAPPPSKQAPPTTLKLTDVTILGAPILHVLKEEELRYPAVDCCDGCKNTWRRSEDTPPTIKNFKSEYNFSEPLDTITAVPEAAANALDPELFAAYLLLPEREKSKGRRGVELELRSLLRKVHCTVWAQSEYKEEEKESSLRLKSTLATTSTNTGNRTLQRMLKVKGHGNPEWEADAQSFLDLFLTVKDRIQALAPPPPADCCRMTQGSFLTDLQSSDVIKLINYTKMDFLANFTFTGIPIYCATNASVQSNPWTLVVKNVVNAPYEILSLKAMETAVAAQHHPPDDRRVELKGNDERTYYNCIVPLVPSDQAELLKPLVRSNVFAVASTLCILKNPHLRDHSCHLAALACVWLKMVTQFPVKTRPAYVVKRLADIEGTAKLYLDRPGLAAYVEVLWTQPSLAVCTDATVTHNEQPVRCESLVKPCFLLHLSRDSHLQLAWRHKHQLPSLVQHLLSEFIGRCLKSHASKTPFSDLYLPPVDGDVRRKWLEQKAQKVYYRLGCDPKRLVVDHYEETSLLRHYAPKVDALLDKVENEQLDWMDLLKLSKTHARPGGFYSWEFVDKEDGGHAAADGLDEDAARAAILPRPNMKLIASLYRRASTGNVSWTQLRAWADELRWTYGVEQFTAGVTRHQQPPGEGPDEPPAPRPPQPPAPAAAPVTLNLPPAGSRLKLPSFDVLKPAEPAAAAAAAEQEAGAMAKEPDDPGVRPVALVQEDIDTAFGDDMVSMYVVRALLHRTSVQRYRWNSVTSPEQARDVMQRHLNAEWKTIARAELLPLVLGYVRLMYRRETYRLHAPLAVPRPMAEVIRLGRERGVDVTEENVLRLYGYRADTGMCRHACMAPACSHFMVPNRLFNRHMEVDRTQPGYPHGLHVTVRRSVAGVTPQTPAQMVDILMTDRGHTTFTRLDRQRYRNLRGDSVALLPGQVDQLIESYTGINRTNQQIKEEDIRRKQEALRNTDVPAPWNY